MDDARVVRTENALIAISEDRSLLAAIGERGNILWTKGVKDLWSGSEVISLPHHLVVVGKTSLQVFRSRGTGVSSAGEPAASRPLTK